MGLQMHGLLLRGRPQVRLLSGTYCEDAKDVSAKKLSFAFYFTRHAVFHFCILRRAKRPASRAQQKRLRSLEAAL